MIQKQNYISLEKRKVFDTPNQTNHPKTSQATFGFGSVRTDNLKLAHPISGRGAGNYGAGSLKSGRLQNRDTW